VDFGAGSNSSQILTVSAFAKATTVNGATIKFQLNSPGADGLLLAKLTVNNAANNGKFVLVNGSSGDVAPPAGTHPVFMVFSAAPVQPPQPVDDASHRYWRVTAGPTDFNTTFYNPLWHICEMELATVLHGPNIVFC
jgi:hypothetical protein